VKRSKVLFCFALAAGLNAQTRSAAALGKQVLEAGLDAGECYRVRDLELPIEDAQFYFTEGYLIFGKPVDGAPLFAVFASDVEGGDAEVLLMPPDRSERKMMAGFIGSPNLDEHFSTGAFFFTDRKARQLLEQIRAAGVARKVPDVGALMADRWNGTVHNLMGGFEARIVLDLLTPGADGEGFFEAVLQGKKLGTFDVVHDARAYEQMIAGQMLERNNQAYWNTWTSFTNRTHRERAIPVEQEVLSYKIDATIDPSLSMRCVTRIRIKATADSRDSIAFDLSGQMRALSAKVDGVPAEVYERDSIMNGRLDFNGNELLLIIPQKPLEAGREYEIEVVHEGKVILESGHDVYYVASRGTWYPSRGLQFSRYDVTWHYPANLSLVAAGEVVEDSTEGDVHTTRRVPDGPVRTLGFNLGHYVLRTVKRDGISVELAANQEVEDALQPKPVIASDFPLPDNRRRRPGTEVIPPPVFVPPKPVPSARIDPIADEILDAAAFYRKRFGEPPLKHIEASPLPGRFGQGFPGMLYLPTVTYLGPLQEPGSKEISEQAFFRDLLRAHEVAHQWWGNIITSGSYHHEWIMESLSNYSALMFMESRLGPRALDTALNSYRRQLFAKGADGSEAEAEGPVVQGGRLQNSNNPAATNAVVYGKGTWIIHMLRRRLGDEQFLKMLAALRSRYEWKPVETDDLRKLCAEFMPKGSPDANLTEFFEQWVYSTGVPTLKMTYSVKGTKLTGTLTQTDAPEELSIPVPIEIQVGKAKPVVKVVHSSSEPVQFTADVPPTGAKAVLDPGWSVLRR
jgi:hypothetical protein